MSPSRRAPSGGAIADSNGHKRAAMIGLGIAGSLTMLVTLFAATNGHEMLAVGIGASSATMLANSAGSTGLGMYF